MMRLRVAVLAGLACLALAAPAAAYRTSGFAIATIAGTGKACAPATGPCGDGGPATAARLSSVTAVALDPAGNLYIADQLDHRIRRVAPNGTIETVAGTGAECSTPTDPCGDGGPATAATFRNPVDVAVGPGGEVYVADSADHRIRRFTPGGTIVTVAGDGNQCPPPGTAACGDGGAATSASLNQPRGLDVDGAGNLYIADTGDSRVRRVSGGTIFPVAGTGAACAPTTAACGDGSAATSAQLNIPFDVTVAGADLYIPDTGTHRVRRVSGGNISTFVGDGTACAASTDPCGDSGPRLSANLSFPTGVARDSLGNLYVSDSGDRRIRRVRPDGDVTTVAGTGNECTVAIAPCGDGGAASLATFGDLGAITLDGAGNLYVADQNSNRVRWMTGPQPGPPGPTGAPGAAGSPGQPGPTGGSGALGAPAPLALFAFQAKVARTRVTVRYATTDDVATRLVVKPPRGRALTVARSRDGAGFNTIAWNRNLRGRRARRGSYRLTVIGTRGTSVEKSALTVRLR